MSEVFSKIDQIGEEDQRRNTALLIHALWVVPTALFLGWFFYNVIATNTDIWNQ